MLYLTKSHPYMGQSKEYCVNVLYEWKNVFVNLIWIQPVYASYNDRTSLAILQSEVH